MTRNHYHWSTICSELSESVCLWVRVCPKSIVSMWAEKKTTLVTQIYRNHKSSTNRIIVWVRWVQYIWWLECLHAPTHRNWGTNEHTKICSPPFWFNKLESVILQNELQLLLICFTSSHFFVDAFESLLKTAPFLVNNRPKNPWKLLELYLSGVWLCGAPCSDESIRRVLKIPSFHHFSRWLFWWFEGFNSVKLDMFVKRKPLHSLKLTAKAPEETAIPKGK